MKPYPPGLLDFFESTFFLFFHSPSSILTFFVTYWSFAPVIELYVQVGEPKLWEDYPILGPVPVTRTYINHGTKQEDRIISSNTRCRKQLQGEGGLRGFGERRRERKGW